MKSLIHQLKQMLILIENKLQNEISYHYAYYTVIPYQFKPKKSLALKELENGTKLFHLYSMNKLKCETVMILE